MQNNPFSLDFGSEPNLYIPRYIEYNKIIETFMSDIPTTHIFVLVGARGTGKTVLMTSVSHKIRESQEWMHIDLNPENDMLNSLRAGIYKRTKGKYPKLKFGLSLKGLNISMDSEDKYDDVQIELDEMISALDKHGIRLLVTIDEVVNSKNIRVFTTYYQHCLRERMPVFVIMTGLYKNVRALQNNRSQTFLRRVPQIHIGPLNLARIAKHYENVFGVGEKEAYEIARHTDGYSYGFQNLGYLLYESGKKSVDKDILFEYTTNLEECSYDKIWEELSEGERKVAVAIAKSPANAQVNKVRQTIEIDSNSFSTYQNVLEKSGILASNSAYGRVDFGLPYFREFVLHTQQGVM